MFYEQQQITQPRGSIANLGAWYQTSDTCKQYPGDARNPENARVVEDLQSRVEAAEAQLEDAIYQAGNLYEQAQDIGDRYPNAQVAFRIADQTVAAQRKMAASLDALANIKSKMQSLDATTAAKQLICYYVPSHSEHRSFISEMNNLVASAEMSARSAITSANLPTLEAELRAAERSLQAEQRRQEELAAAQAVAQKAITAEQERYAERVAAERTAAEERAVREAEAQARREETQLAWQRQQAEWQQAMEQRRWEAEQAAIARQQAIEDAERARQIAMEEALLRQQAPPVPAAPAAPPTTQQFFIDPWSGQPMPAQPQWQQQQQTQYFDYGMYAMGPPGFTQWTPQTVQQGAPVPVAWQDKAAAAPSGYATMPQLMPSGSREMFGVRGLGQPQYELASRMEVEEKPGTAERIATSIIGGASNVISSFLRPPQPRPKPVNWGVIALVGAGLVGGAVLLSRR